MADSSLCECHIQMSIQLDSKVFRCNFFFMVFQHGFLDGLLD